MVERTEGPHFPFLEGGHEGPAPAERLAKYSLVSHKSSCACPPLAGPKPEQPFRGVAAFRKAENVAPRPEARRPAAISAGGLAASYWFSTAPTPLQVAGPPLSATTQEPPAELFRPTR